MTEDPDFFDFEEAESVRRRFPDAAKRRYAPDPEYPINRHEVDRYSRCSGTYDAHIELLGMPNFCVACQKNLTRF